MISVSQATGLILKRQVHFGVEKTPLRQSYNRVLAEDLRADRDFPPFTRVAMDGIAIAHQAFAQGRRTFPVAGIQAAGAPRQTLNSPDQCLEVMTGAILPQGTDTVVRYEDLDIQDGLARILISDVRKGQNAHPKASDRRQGDLIVPAGRLIGAGEAGLAAAIGKVNVLVRRPPKTLIVYTGDELVDLHISPLPHQIRASNVFTIDLVLSNWGVQAASVHLVDEKDLIRRQLRQSLEEYDLLVLNGGVSKGKFDFIPETLEALGVQKQFHRVKQRPGKPFWFGYTDRATVFALPGNPVSSFLCLCRYLIPWLRQNLGMPPFLPNYARLTESFYNKSPLTCFIPVSISSNTDGFFQAVPQLGRGSGDLANLTEANAFLELPPGPQVFETDVGLPFIPCR